MTDSTLTPVAVASVSLPVVGQPRERCDAVRNRRRILDAARAIVASDGARGLSMNAVAAAASVGKGTIFRRFGDREGLLFALLDEDTSALQDGFLSGPAPLGPGAPAAERLEAFVLAYLRFELHHLELLIAADRGQPEAASPVLSAFGVHVATLVAEIDPTVDAEVIGWLILSSLSPGAIRRLTERGVSPEALERSALTLVRGIARANSWPELSGD